MSMYDERIEGLINAALADGNLSEKEKQILYRNAEAEGIDLDEFEMVLQSRLYEAMNARNQTAAQAMPPIPNMAPPMPAAAAQSAAPKSNKFGDIRKCPACGAIVTTGMAACVECGYAFNEDSAMAMDKLYDRLDAIDQRYDEMIRRKDKRADSKWIWSSIDEDDLKEAIAELNEKRAMDKATAIRSFNVPNTRSELLGMLTTIQPICNPTGCKDGYNNRLEQEDLSFAYWELYTSCINKAKISFANDKAFEPYFKFYDEGAGKKRGFFSSLFNR